MIAQLVNFTRVIVMKMKRNTLVTRKLVVLLVLCFPFGLNAAERWYSQSQVDKGRTVFNTNCAICHGAEAAGTTPDWRKPQDDGRYPAPPLNGTAHGWHHPLISLRRQINQGGAKYGGWMPALGKSLTDEQVDESIAYIQSLWPDKVYAAWLKNDAAQSGDFPATVPTAKKSEQNNILRHLSSRLPNSKFGEPEETPLKGIFRLSMDDSIIYVSSDGRYVFLGDMVDLKEGRNFSKKGLP
jgi:mono/diheme cytochrome c family protein